MPRGNMASPDSLVAEQVALALAAANLIAADAVVAVTGQIAKGQISAAEWQSVLTPKIQVAEPTKGLDERP